MGVYTAVVLSIFIQGPQDIAMPGIAPNATGRFTGLSATTFSNNLYCKISQTLVYLYINRVLFLQPTIRLITLPASRPTLLTCSVCFLVR